jgi:hypothetical protein
MTSLGFSIVWPVRNICNNELVSRMSYHWPVNETMSWLDVYLIKWSVCNHLMPSSSKCPSDEMTNWWNDQCMKWPIDEMTNWWNDQLMKWTIDELTNWWNDQLMKWPIDEMTNWWNDQLKKWLIDDMTFWWND